MRFADTRAEVPPPITPTLDGGLSAAQVEARTAAGLTNRRPPDPARGIGRILREHLFTLFNGINLLVAVCLLCVGAYRHMLFMGVVLSAAAIGIFQELRAKRVLSRLQILTAAQVTVVRDGQEQILQAESLVRDDILWLSLGDQVPVDGTLMDGELVVDESLLTGESDPIRKLPGDGLLSGSAVLAGRGRVHAARVGAEAYSVQLSQQAKRHKRIQSEWMRALSRMIRWMSVVILPVGGLLFLSQYFFSASNLYEAVVGASAGVIGMIPEGLVLLVFLTYAVGAIRLSRRGVLVQTLPSIETLARVDVLCLDKTGTITTGKMRVDACVPLGDEGEMMRALRRLAWSLPAVNPTSQALQAHFGEMAEGERAVRVAHFSSAAKWSGAEYGDGTVVLGAPTFVMPELDAEIEARIEEYAGTGLRALLLCGGNGGLPGDGGLPKGLEALGIVLFREEVRASAAETFAYFEGQDVRLKIISGDSAQTVQAVARQAGFHASEALDMRTLPEGADLRELVERYTFFGRVSPEQKKALVEALQQNGHTVGMTGDGVNDVLALKQADCSIAMAGGSGAARQVAELVLFESDFGSLVGVVNEGRRAVNNMTSVSTLYLVKTVYSLCLSVIYMLMRWPYPFFPIHQTLIGMLMTGVPSFLLALQPNTRRVERDFMRRVILAAIPTGLGIAAGITGLRAVSGAIGVPDAVLYTMNTMIAGGLTWMTLVRAAMPLTPVKTGLVGMSIGLFGAAILGFWRVFAFAPPTGMLVWVGIPAVLVAMGVATGIRFALKRGIARWHGSPERSI